MIISITGTPGTGKTYLSKKLSQSLKIYYLDLNALIKKEKLYDSYNKKDKTFEVDTKKLSKLMNELLKPYKSKNFDLKKYFPKSKSKNFISFNSISEIQSLIKKIPEKNNILVDSHLSHYIKCDLCIVVKTDIKKLNKRLNSRNYSRKKIRDNIDCEIFDVCLDESLSLRKNVVVINN